MAKYLACGNVIYDTVESIEGVNLGEHLGGQAVYAAAGIRLWTKDVKMVSCVGADFKEGYSPWLKANGLSDESIRVEVEYCSHVYMQHTESGAYNIVPNPHNGLMYLNYEQGFLETRPEHIEEAIGPDTMALYHHTHMPDKILFEKMRKIREKYDVKFMWELMFSGGSMWNTPYFNLQKLKDAAEIAGMWSLNRNEAAVIFDIPRENDEDMINELMKFPGVEMCYYRVGSKGAYVVTPTNAYFCPMINIASTDPMGCGNCSTGTSMYAWCETGDPLMTAIMSGISAGYNAAQSGPWPVATEQDTLNAQKMAKEYYEKLKGNYHC